MAERIVSPSATNPRFLMRQEADSFLASKDFEKAIPKLLELLSFPVPPKEHSLDFLIRVCDWTSLARSYAHLGHPKEGLEVCERVFEMMKSCCEVWKESVLADAHTLKAYCYKKSADRKEEALKEYGSALELRSRWFSHDVASLRSLYVDIMEFHIVHRNFKEAIQSGETAFKLYQEKPQGDLEEALDRNRLTRGFAQIEKSLNPAQISPRWQQAIADCFTLLQKAQQCKESDYSLASILLILSEAYQQSGQLENALKTIQEAYKNVLSQYPERHELMGPYLYRFVLLYEAQMLYDSVVALSKEALDYLILRNPQAPLIQDFYYHQGISLFQLKKYSEAISSFEKALEFCSKNPLLDHTSALAKQGIETCQKIVGADFSDLAQIAEVSSTDLP